MSPPRRERVDIDLPFFHIHVEEGGVHLGADDEEVIDMERDESRDYYEARRRVRRRLRFFRHVFTFVLVNGFFALLDWATGGEDGGVNWAQWVALIWGVLLAWEFTSTFVSPVLWGPELEDRLVKRELRR